MVKLIIAILLIFILAGPCFAGADGKVRAIKVEKICIDGYVWIVSWWADQYQLEQFMVKPRGNMMSLPKKCTDKEKRHF